MSAGLAFSLLAEGLALDGEDKGIQENAATAIQARVHLPSHPPSAARFLRFPGGSSSPDVIPLSPRAKPSSSAGASTKPGKPSAAGSKSGEDPKTKAPKPKSRKSKETTEVEKLRGQVQERDQRLQERDNRIVDLNNMLDALGADAGD